MAFLETVLLCTLITIIAGVAIPLIKILKITAKEMEEDRWNKAIGKK